MAADGPGMAKPSPRQDSAVAPPGRVLYRSVRYLDHAPPGLSQSETEIDVLRTVEVRLIEPADLFESGSSK